MSQINKTKHIFIALFLLFCTVCQLDAQVLIKGIVRDDVDMPVSYSSIVLYKDSTIVQGTTSSDDGSFQLKGNFSGDYKLKISFIGYDELVEEITVNKERKLDLGKLVLVTKSQMLSDVVVTADAAAKKVSIDKTSINASSSIGASTGSVLDILRSSASVSVDNAANVSIRGNSNILILIDGIPTTNTALDAIPAGNVQKIDIITSPDVKYDSEGTGGIINIISKSNVGTGISGMASFNYGFLDMLNGNLALGYNSEKWNVRFNYNGSFARDEIVSTLDRHMKVSDATLNQNVHANLTTYNNVVGANATFKASKKDILSLGIKAMFPRNNNIQNFHNVYNGGENEKYRQTDITFNREVIEGTIGYKRRIEPDKKELSLLASVSQTRGKRPSFYYEANQLIQKSVSGGRPLSASLQLDYMHKLGRGKLETGVKMSVRNNDIDHQFFEMNPSTHQWEYSTAMSNDLQHTEYIPAIYAMYSGVISDKLSYQAGLRYEPSKVELRNRKEGLNASSWNHFLSPELSMDYKIREDMAFAFRLSRRISRPTYPQLNPYTNLIDNNTYETGNIYLEPETSNKIDLNYSYNSQYINVSASLYLNYIQDYITQVAVIKDTDLIMTYINGEWDKKKGVELLLKIKPVKWMEISINDNFYHTETTGTYEGAEIGNNGFVNSLNGALNFKPLNGLNIQVQYFYTTPQYFPQFTTKPIHYMDLSVRYAFLKNTLAVSATVTDVFNTRDWNIYSDNVHYELSNYSKNKSRMLWLGVSYNFNSFKPSSKQTKKEEDRSLIRFGN